MEFMVCTLFYVRNPKMTENPTYICCYSINTFMLGKVLKLMQHPIAYLHKSNNTYISLLPYL